MVWSRLLIRSACIALLLTFFAIGAYAEDRIAFLHLKIEGNRITLLDTKIVPGKLKELRGITEKSGLKFETVSLDNKITPYKIMNNPLVRKFEYENPENPGKLISKIIVEESAEFTIRINYEDNLDHLNFYTVEMQPNKANASATFLNKISLTSAKEESHE